MTIRLAGLTLRPLQEVTYDTSGQAAAPDCQLSGGKRCSYYGEPPSIRHPSSS